MCALLLHYPLAFLYPVKVLLCLLIVCHILQFLKTTLLEFAFCLFSTPVSLYDERRVLLLLVNHVIHILSVQILNEVEFALH